MIQRIQSLYLLLAAGLMAVFCFVPFATILSDGELCRQTVWGIFSTGEAVEKLVPTTPMGILTAISALLPLVILFLYKKRGLQMRLCAVELILLAGTAVYLVMFLVRSSKVADHTAFSVVDLFPLLAIVLSWMAFRRIMRDEILVKSLDRIR